jgi:hydrogenase expression/formation protein HypC
MCLAVPGRVREVYEAHGTRMGKLDFGGVVKEVCLAYVPDLAVGEYAIVHVGFALSKVDETSAIETLKTFQDMGFLDEEVGEAESPLP